MALFLLPAAQASALDSPRHFSDSDYHELVLYDMDQTRLDILILPSASPYALRELALIQQSLQSWRDGIETLAPPWLSNGLNLHWYTVGIDPTPIEALWDPEIIIVSSEFNPAALAGAGIEPMNFFGAYLCHEQAPPHVPSNDELAQIPGFHQHGDTGMGRTECGNGGTTCLVVNSNALWFPDEANRRDMHDLASHEIGHCLGLGHVGDALDFTAAAYPRDDVMSYGNDGHAAGHALCPSTLNVRVLAQVYGTLLGQPGYPMSPAGSYVTMHPADWHASHCMEPTAIHTDLDPVLKADPLGQAPSPPPTRRPELNITSPKNGFELHGPSVVVSGTADRGNAKPRPAPSPLPTPTPGYVGSTYAYQHVQFPAPIPTLGDHYGVGASNLAAFATTLAGDPVPKYPAGSLVDLALRGATGDNLSVDLPGTFTLLDEDGVPVDGLLSATGDPDGSALQWNVNHPYTLPAESGRYYIAVHVTLNGEDVLFSDPAFTGLKPIDIIDPASTLPIGSVLGVSPDPDNDGAVPGVLGEVGDATVTDSDGRLTVTLHIPGFLDALTPGPNGNPFVYQVQFKASHNGIEQDYILQYTYESDPTTLTVGRDTFALYVLSSPSTTGLRTPCLVTATLPGSSYTAPTAIAKWVVDLGEFDHGNRAAQNDCAGFTRTGRGLQAGDVLRDVMGSASLKLATLQASPPQDKTAPVSYTVRSGSPPPLVADAGEGYRGQAGTPIAIRGAAMDAAGTYSCAWSGPDATFADPDVCSTTVTYAPAGTHTLYFIVTDSTGATATDSATATVTAPPPPERVQIELAGRTATALIDTFASRTVAWNASLDLTGLAGGAYTLTATWIDADGTLVDSASLTLNLSNHPPQLLLPENQSVAERELLAFTVAATDPDADAVSLSCVEIPAGATFDADTGAFEWTPSYEQAGHYTVSFTASDGNGGTATASLIIHVVDVNRAPVLDFIANVTAQARSEIRFTLHAEDPNGRTVAYSATNLPTGATLDPANGSFAWIPTKKQAGSHTVTFRASDGALEDVQDVHFTIHRSSSPLDRNESRKET